MNAPNVKSRGNDSNPRRVHSPLIWSGDQGTLNHEFVVQSGIFLNILIFSFVFYFFSSSKREIISQKGDGQLFFKQTIKRG